MTLYFKIDYEGKIWFLFATSLKKINKDECITKQIHVGVGSGGWYNTNLNLIWRARERF